MLARDVSTALECECTPQTVIVSMRALPPVDSCNMIGGLETLKISTSLGSIVSELHCYCFVSMAHCFMNFSTWLLNLSKTSRTF